MNPTQHDRIKRVLQRKMGLIAASGQEAEIDRDWRAIIAWLRADPKRAEELAGAMFQPLMESVQHVLTTPRDRSNPALVSRWSRVWSLLRGQGELPNMMLHRVATLLEGADVLAPPKPAPAVAKPPATPVSTAPEPPAPPPVAEEKREGPAPSPDETAAAAPEPPTPTCPPEEAPMTPPPADGAPTAAWKVLPVPDDHPDRHDEHANRSAPDAPAGFRLIGARVRGKKHKHEGTNCDDWFDFRASGPWTVIAVADGAGSYRFSRVGARASCEAAVEHLAAALREHRLESRAAWSNETFRRDDTWAFAEGDLQVVQDAIHEAMNRAYWAVEEAVVQRRGDATYEKLLGRPLTVNDLSATLLLAAHTTVRFQDTECSFVLACQVGDGMTAAVDGQGRLQLLGEADSGAFSGETDFLTSKNKLERDNLRRKTFGFFRPLRALMVMTDGVADDYFPNDPGMLRLYGDLVLNGVIELRGPSDEEVMQALEKTRLRTPAEIETADFAAESQAPTVDGARPMRLRSVAAYAEKLGLPPEEVVASPALLAVGARGAAVGEGGPAERLLLWLDSYHVRGSFDDRTLVVLHPEQAP